MKRTLALLALMLAVPASTVSAGPVKPPAKPKQTYNYCLGFIRPPKCFTLPPAAGKQVDKRIFEMQRHEVQ